MKANHQSGFLEAKVQQDKIFRLNQKDADKNSHLKALLEYVLFPYLYWYWKISIKRRKQRWEEQQISTESEMRQQLIQHVEEGKFFHCTVEVR